MMEIGGNLKAKGKNRLGSKNWKPRAIILWNSHEIWHGFKSQMAGSKVNYQRALTRKPLEEEGIEPYQKGFLLMFSSQ